MQGAQEEHTQHLLGGRERAVRVCPCAAERAPKTRHEEHLPQQESLQAFEEHAKPSFQKTTLERSCVLADATPGQPGSEPEGVGVTC